MLSPVNLHSGFCSRLSDTDQETGPLCRIRRSKAVCSMRQVPLQQMTAVPAAWPLETVLDAWVHTACALHYNAHFQHTLDLLEQRLAELWEPQAKPNLAAELLQRGRAELQRRSVLHFTNEGLVQWNGGWHPSDWSRLEAPCQRLAQRLTAVEDSAAEEAKKRRRVEEDIFAAHELQKAKEENVRLAGCLQEAWDSRTALRSLVRSVICFSWQIE